MQWAICAPAPLYLSGLGKAHTQRISKIGVEIVFSEDCACVLFDSREIRLKEEEWEALGWDIFKNYMS